MSSYSDIVYVQNLPRKYICLKKSPGLLRGGVGLGLGTMLARRGDIEDDLGAFWSDLGMQNQCL